MPRPSIDLEPRKAFILKRYSEKTPVSRICTELSEQFGITVGRSTLFTQLRKWEVAKHQVKTVDSDSLREALEDKYWAHTPNDKQLHEFLVRRGFTVSLSGVTILRRKLGISRLLNKHQLAERKARILDFLQSSPSSSMLLPRLGYRAARQHVHQIGHVNISERGLRQLLAEQFPEQVQVRLQQIQTRRAGFTLPGPNYTWSVDGHCKLQHWGFEIYGGIDAYSRFVNWSYVGVSALTQRSVFAQYLCVVREFGVIPMVMRSDRGGETVMVAGAHYWLSLGANRARRLRPRRNREGQVEWYMLGNDGQRAHRVDRDAMDPDAPLYGPEEPVVFEDCWSYGKSTKNQRIESWWNQLCRARTGYWRVSYPTSELELLAN